LEAADDDTDFATRFLCHLIIDRIPAEGMNEVCQSLKEFYEYYEPSVPTKRYLTATHDREAVMGVQAVRPVFTIEGE
jgi:hypothetical protein